MFFKKGSLIFIIVLILLFGLSSIIQAAPLLQESDTVGGASTTGDTVQNDDEDDDGDNDKDEKEKDEKDKGDDGDEKDDDDQDDDGDNDKDEKEKDEKDKGDDDDEKDEGDAGDRIKLHPVANRLADLFGVSYDDIMGLHVSGNGFGTISKAYFFSDKLGMAPGELLDAAHGHGWGNVLKEGGLHPGMGKDKEKGTPPGQLKKNGDEVGGQGNGKGNNGNQGGNGKDKDKDNGNNGNGKGKDK